MNSKNLSDKNNEFENRIKINQDNEELRLLKLQKQYKSGKIKQEDISDEDYEKLVKLYIKQNNELKNKINIAKERIRKKIKNLK